jgi:2,4-dienoyl-CoA reductase-like NADH-dependent reductase (Old Yellow Enzyme family)/thioredoxin reductase
MLKYPHLFEPIRLGNTVFKNRLFGAPISGRIFENLSWSNENDIAFFEQKAIGGAASVCLGDCVVDSKLGKSREPTLSFDDPACERVMNQLAGAIRRHGAVASVELQHTGIYAHLSRERGEVIYGPSEGVDSEGNVYYEMPEDVIEYIIEAFAAAAARAKRCGFGMVTLHGGHGWLLSQFMSSKVNKRKDRWGGSVENRMRFPIAVCQAVRRAVGPGFPIEIRISGSEVTPLGYDLDEGIAIAKMLDGHVDLIHVSAGHHERPEVFTVTHPSLFMEDSANIIYAAEIKKHVKTPVASVGAHCDPELMEEIIASGKADVIQMARAIMADSDLPRKARAGEDVRPCLRCLACFSHIITNYQTYCAVNPLIGRELEYRFAQPPAENKTVLIAGGGVGGLQAAVTAARNGHKVILCERSDKLGGVLRCEDHVPFKKKIKEYLDYQVRMVEKAGVEVRLNTEVTPEYAEEIKPDVIIAALGARPVCLPISGADLPHVFTAEGMYGAPDQAGERVVVLGGGLVGQELAVYLAGMGRDVTIVEMQPALNSGGNVLHQMALDVEIQRLGIKTSLSTKALAIDEKGVSAERDGETVFFPANTVVCAVGQVPLSEEAYALSSCAPEFYVVGDCTEPKNIMQATSMADAAARNIGRFSS